MKILVWLFLIAEVHASPSSTFTRERAHREISSHRIRPERKSQRLESGGCHGADIFICVDGFTICHNQRCDSFQDCPYGDDEEACGCAKGRFLCDGVRCLLEERRCDGNQDCKDNTDEEDCLTTTAMTASAVDSILHSTTQVSNTGCGQDSFVCDIDKCILESKRCDGSQDCRDNSDEEDCFTATIKSTTPVKGCSPGEFRCDANRCLSDEKKCNKEFDCLDNSDEDNCTESPWVYSFPSSRTSISGCGQDSFVCDIDKCILESKRCDGSQDCRDNSDEEDCFTASTQSTTSVRVSNTRCGQDSFVCDIDKCILESKRCDGSQDCRDNSDEEDCFTATTQSTTTQRTTTQHTTSVKVSNTRCGQDSFVCDIDKCILESKRCDGSQDCRDNSDEEDCFTATTQSTTTQRTTTQHTTSVKGCHQDSFVCDIDKCILESKRCDGSQDCRDNSDEEDCFTATTQSTTTQRTTTQHTTSVKVSNTGCGQDSFVCDIDKCILESKRCDGSQDCRDNSDEEDCFTATTQSTTSMKACGTDQWMCRDGSCIPKEYRCDIRQDCSDSSDEEGCSNACSPSQLMCRDGSCVPKKFRCDGRYDCPDFSDEEGCSKVCNTNEWKCWDEACIPRGKRCDGHPDCQDESDEDGCQITCEVGQWQCDDGHCIGEDLLCDGEVNCEDYSDEIKCRTECGPGKWQCHDLYCVDENLRCDGIPQCFDSSDEENCSGHMWKCWDGWWIKSDQRCDGFYHCYDGSDEFFCEFTFL
ncbi:low-density lipoprotein receptor-related protein 2-like isoform X2 [Macrobrachium nipponense]|uniref:low-density lipoprotein receptor-related protein 2-like isoform X2 n=1 Tax=Macrobrachium nipponense TaxID=159736 RepID=UPI0030C7B86F